MHQQDPKSAASSGRKVIWTTLALVAFFISLRPSTTKIPGSDRSLSQFTDQWWDQSISNTKMQSRAFDERFGSAFEKFPTRTEKALRELFRGELTPKLSQPYLGEPLALAGLVRRFPEIESIAVSSRLAAKDELYQRLFEGLYPVLVSEEIGSKYRLVTLDETSSCELLGKTEEAQLVRCP
jgi:hypothetical protein